MPLWIWTARSRGRQLECLQVDRLTNYERSYSAYPYPSTMGNFGRIMVADIDMNSIQLPSQEALLIGGQRLWEHKVVY